MSWNLKKIVSTAVNPITSLASPGTDYLKGAIFGNKATNTYNAPNVDFLRDPTPAVNYDFLRQSPDLTQGFKSYKDYYNPSSAVADQRFNQYATAIGAPSSTDQVRSELNRDQLNSQIGDIERDTTGRFGQSLVDSFGKGLFDPAGGGDSSIAQSRLGTIAAEGARTAANARTTLGLADIERQAQREQALNQAYGQRYAAGESQDTAARGYANDAANRYGSLYSQNATLGNQRDLAYLAGQNQNVQNEMARRYKLSDILNGQASGVSSGYQPSSYGAFGNFLNSFGNAAGKTLGA